MQNANHERQKKAKGVKDKPVGAGDLLVAGVFTLVNFEHLIREVPVQESKQEHRDQKLHPLRADKKLLDHHDELYLRCDTLRVLDRDNCETNNRA